MPLTSARFASDPRLQAAAENSPPMGWGERGPAVVKLQQALVDLGYPMPVTTKSGHPDGIYGGETRNSLIKFQRKNGLSDDGIAGRMTLSALDALFPAGGTGPNAIAYMVPGTKVVIAQPTSLVCWATVYTMMRSWRLQESKGIRDSVAAVEEKYGVMVDNNQALPGTEFKPFIRKASMQLEQMASYPVEVWLDWLQTYGLLWVGTMNSVAPGAGRHSRIVQGIAGTGVADTTYFHIIDPDGGRQYLEAFNIFLLKYENAVGDDEYYQIRHF